MFPTDLDWFRYVSPVLFQTASHGRLGSASKQQDSLEKKARVGCLASETHDSFFGIKGAMDSIPYDGTGNNYDFSAGINLVPRVFSG